MNKYLMLSAAAVLSSVATAHADTYCFGFGTTGGNPYCDGGMLFTYGAVGGLRTWRHLNNDCGGGESHGLGLLGKTRGLGNVSLMSDNMSAVNYGSSSISESFLLPKKIKNGAPWSLYTEFSGSTVFVGNGGVLINVTNCQNATKNHGRTSTLAQAMEIIRAHRKAKDGVTAAP